MSLGGFHLLAIVNNVVMSMDVQITVCVPVFSSFEYILRSEIAESCGNSILVVGVGREATILSYIPTSRHKGSNFSISSPTPIIVCVCLFHSNHPNRCEVVLICYFPN